MGSDASFVVLLQAAKMMASEIDATATLNLRILIPLVVINIQVLDMAACRQFSYEAEVYSRLQVLLKIL